MAADMLTNHLVRDLDDHDLSVLHTRNTQNGLVGVACVNPLHKKNSRPVQAHANVLWSLLKHQVVIIIGVNITAFGRESTLFQRQPVFPLFS